MAFEAGKILELRVLPLWLDVIRVLLILILADSTAETCFCVQALPATGLRFVGGIEISENMHTFL